MLFEEWIEQAYSLGASDLHLEADTPIVARIRGELQTVGAPVAGAALDPGRARAAGRRALARFRRARFGRHLGIGRRHPAARQLLSDRARAGDRHPAAGAERQGSAGCNLHKDFRKLIDARSGPDHRFRADRIGQVDDARGAHRGDQCDPRAPHHHAREPDRISVRQPPILHPATRNPDALAELRAGHHRFAAREPRRAGDRRNAHARGDAPHPERRGDRTSGARDHALGELRGGVDPAVHVLSLGHPAERARAARRLPGGRVLPAAGVSRRPAPARAALRNPAADLGREGHDPKRELQPDRRPCCSRAARRACGPSSAISAGWIR